MSDEVYQVLLEFMGVLVLTLPVIAIKWNLAGEARRRSSLLAPESAKNRWRVEIYSTDEDALAALVDPAEVPFPVKRVRSAKADLALQQPETAWTLPRVELDVEIGDPLADESLAGLFGADHKLRFVSGNEAVLDTSTKRLRVLAFRHL